MQKAFLILFILIAIVRLLGGNRSSYEGKTLLLSGTLTSEPKEYEDSYLISLNNISVFVPKDIDIRYGSFLKVSGIYKDGLLRKPKVLEIKAPTSILALVREKILLTLNSTIPEPESSLLAGVTLGAPNIPKKFSDALMRTGTTHVVVASGGNLAIIAMFLERVLSKYLSRKVFLPLIAFVLLFYSLLTGFAAPIVRALILWLIIMLSQLTGRVIDSRLALLITALMMVIYNPLWVKDISFQLSIGATAGVMLFTEPISRRIKFKKLSILKESFSTSLGAQIGVLPISIFAFKNINILSPIWNTLVLWTIPYITILGLLGSFFSLVWEPIGRVLFWGSYPFTWYFVRIVNL